MAREKAFALTRTAIAAVILLLALVALLALAGPKWFLRLYHPLKYTEEIQAASDREEVNPYLIAAVINAESGFDAKEVSPRGAVGLMQLREDTAEEMVRREKLDVTVGRESLRDPKTNILIGTVYLKWLIGRYHNVVLALAAYNGGLVAADRWAKEAKGPAGVKDIGYPETRHYVDKVLRQRNEYMRLYPEEFEWNPK